MSKRNLFTIFCAALALTFLGALLVLPACGGGSGGNSGDPSRPFLMGNTPFFATPTEFPAWRFDHAEDSDLFSLHVDDFLGVPWTQCNATGCSGLPAAWVAQWQALANAAHASGKKIFLTVSPLGQRKSLAKSLQADGSYNEYWLPGTVLDANGCYLFASDANANNYKAAYIGYMKYLIDLVHPDYLAPAVEMNMPFTTCPAQKAAWIAWYSDVHAAIKAAHPSLPIFATFQMQSMYGSIEPSAACPAGTSYSACFDQRLAEALTIPGDRIAFSSYPIGWSYSPEFGYSFPKDTFARVQQATSRKIWISETGWATVPVRVSYLHGTTATCGTWAFTDTLEVPGVGTVNVANDAGQATYLEWLLDEAQARRLEAVVWWLDRDYLDASVAQGCPCEPATSDTCAMANLFYTVGGNYGEMSLRNFGNMALRNYDGTTHAAYASWKRHLDMPYAP